MSDPFLAFLKNASAPPVGPEDFSDPLGEGLSGSSFSIAPFSHHTITASSVTSPESVDHKSKDLVLYNQWAKTKSKKDLGVLVNHLSPLIYKEVSRVSGSLPVSTLSAEAKVWTAKAIHTYDPSKGFALSTHVMNYMARVRRLNYKYQNVARLPENKQLQFHEYNKALTQLSDELNRDPSEEEMASRLGWSKGQVIKFKGTIFSDLLESKNERPTEYSHFDDTSIRMKHLRDQLTDQERFIWDNKDKMSATQLAAKLGVNTNRFNYLQKKLIQKIGELKRELEI